MRLNICVVQQRDGGNHDTTVQLREGGALSPGIQYVRDYLVDLFLGTVLQGIASHFKNITKTT